MKKLSRFPEKRTAGAVRFSTRGALLTKVSSLVQLQYRQECLRRHLHRAQRPHLFLARPQKSPAFSGTPHFTGRARQSPSLPRSCALRKTLVQRSRAGRLCRLRARSLVQLQYRQECLRRHLHRTQRPHLFLARPQKSPAFSGTPHFTGRARQSPSLPRSCALRKTLVQRSRAGRLCRLRAKITRPASIPPGMPPSAPAPYPATASFSCPLFAFPAASSFSSRRRRSTSPARPCAWP